MATLYKQADMSTDARHAYDVRERFHSDLDVAGVTISTVFAFRDDDGPALKHHGWPARAIIKINPLDKRAEGLQDVTLLIDGHWWGRASPAERLALVDHELTHLVLRLDKEGKVKPDDCGRPKLKIRPHDWEFTGFAVVAQRHGQNSGELQHARKLADRFGQLLFPWAVQEQAVKDYDEVLTRILEGATAQVNAGALDGDGVKVTAARRTK